MNQSNYIRYDNQFHRPRKKKSDSGFTILVVLTSILVVTVIVVALISLNPSNNKVNPNNSTGIPTTPDGQTATGIIIATSTPTPAISMAAYQNPVLFPGTSMMNVLIGQPGAGMSVSERGVTQSAMIEDIVQAPYARGTAISMGDPVNYQTVPGILTFRGNNFRNCASWGTVDVAQGTLQQVWEYGQVGSMASSAWDFAWTGTGWTGQPLAIQWDWDVQQLMNMYPIKKAKQGLTEVIIAAMDGKIYFFDLDDGEKTRDPINVGVTIKGTPCVDPRGYPMLYVGQGDDNGADGKIGFRIYNLINSTQIYFQDGMDARAYRTNWGACDSSPIVNGASDTLIYPNENGMIYTVKLNTYFDRATGALAINPESVVFRYLINDISASSIGIESSIAVYDHYGYCSDNSGNLICVDLNTLELVWVRQLDDDSDVTPVIEEEAGRVYLYIGTEVDWQRTDQLNYQGASYTYKIDAMTGDQVWQTSESCWTKNGEDKGDDINGGMLGTPIVGKKSISNLVIFSYCMTKDLFAGNRLVAYDKDTGEKVWTYEMNMYSWSSPVDCYDAEGNAYIVMCDSVGQIHLVNAQTGVRIVYLQTLRNKGTANETKNGLNMESSPIVVNGMIVIGTRAGSIFGVKIA
jgi:outer membrane protein assembly factor BamB